MSMEDNFSVQRFAHRISNLPEPRIPLIANNTGPIGRMSRCFNPILTPISLQGFEDTNSMSATEGSVIAKEAQQALHASFILNKM